jgi:RNA polymerase sigma factor (sigma-70 family)
MTQRRAGCPLELEELESVAQAAALDAVRRYDARRAGFAPYVAQRIRWALLAYARKRRRRLDPRRGFPMGIALRFSDMDVHAVCVVPVLVSNITAVGTFAPSGDLGNMAVCPNDDPEQALARKRTHDSLRLAIDDLSEPARTLLGRHYFDGERLDAAAHELGISKHSAYRIHRGAVRTLRRRLRREALDG